MRLKAMRPALLAALPLALVADGAQAASSHAVRSPNQRESSTWLGSGPPHT